MFGKISVRNIPQNVFNALETLAIKHDRSTEAEVRQAIQAWVEPTLVQEERNTRCRVVAERLNRMLEQVNNYGAHRWRPSHVAMEIGLERAALVEDWFLGAEEPTFAQLERIAELFGIQPAWLIHGDGKIYPVESVRLSENPEYAVEWLTGWEGDDDKLSALHLIRANDESGSLYIVKESKRERFKIYYTQIHVSEMIGAGGESTLMHLFVTLELLYKRWTRGGVTYHVKGHQLHPEVTTLLSGGNINPGPLLQNKGASMWWEDIWHKKMVDKNSYWPGWGSLCSRIERSIAATPRMVEQRERIRNGDTDA